VFQFEDFAFDVNGDFLGQVAIGDSGGDSGDVADLGGKVGGHEVDRVGEILPGAGDTFDLGLAAESAFGADFAGHARHFRGEGTELVHHRIDGVFEFEELPADV